MTDETKQDGGAAFPYANDADKEYNWINRGMTLRDWFAGQALIGLINAGIEDVKRGRKSDATDIAEGAYRLADAMLEARKK